MIALCSKDFNNLNRCFSKENKSHCMDKETFFTEMSEESAYTVN